MTKGSKEFYEIRDEFEKFITSKHFQHYLPAKIERAPKAAMHNYENGAVDMAFTLYQAGYALGRSVYMEPGHSRISGLESAFRSL